MATNSIKSFTDLDTWKYGHKLVISTYQATSDFPKQEQYGLTSQIRRSALSVTSNIAEGFSRQGKKEKIQFYYIAKGSLTEFQNQLLVAKDVSYLKKETFENLANQTIMVSKLLTGLIRSANQK